MFPEPITHRFTIAGEPYCLVEYDTAGEDRIRAYYSAGIASAPDVMDALYGVDLYAKAVARECLKEAPAIFWKEQRPAASQNGEAVKVISFEGVHRLQWAALRKEVDSFLESLQKTVPDAPASTIPAVPAEPPHVELVETVPALLQGRAG